MSKSKQNSKSYWRSASRRKTTTRLKVLGSQGAGAGQEFAPGAEELVVEGGASRRKFMGLIGASTALAGLSSSACVRKPVEHIMPFAKRPEDRIPGMPQYFASAYQVGGTVMGILVESHDGRPTKIEGNPQHSGSQGATDVFAQASVFNLYDPDRSTAVFSTEISAYTKGAKEEAIETLCHHVEQHTLETKNSIDAAAEARAKCEAMVAEDGGATWRTVERDGATLHEVSVKWDAQLESSWENAWTSLLPTFEKLHVAGGEGLALVVPGSLSPSFRAAQQRFVQTYPKAKVVLSDPTFPVNTLRAAEMVGGEGAVTFHSLKDASVIVAVDSDFLSTEQDHVRLAREWSARRKVRDPSDGAKMSRLYAVESHLSVTGAAADNRLRLPSRDMVDFLCALIIELVETHELELPPGTEALGAVVRTRGAFDDKTTRFVAALAEDLVNAAKSSAKPGLASRDMPAVLVGERQPPLAHGLGYLISTMLRASSSNPPGTLRFNHRTDTVPYARVAELAAGLEDGTITHVVCLGTNPVYDAPGALGMGEKLAKAELLVHAGMHLDETGRVADWHLPTSHYLEAWGDLEAFDGTVSIQQPLIAPLYGTRSTLEILEMLVPTKGAGGEWALSPIEVPSAKIVRDYWSNEIANGSRGNQELSDDTWNTWLHEGLVTGVPRSRHTVRPNRWSAFADLMAQRSVEDAPFEVDFHLDPKVLAGEYTNNGWMQELPHPISKLVWDNGAYISGALAAELGVDNGDNLAIKVGDVSIQVPAWIAPGQHDRTVSLNLGYGREGIGLIAEGAGVDVNVLRTDERGWFAGGEVSRGSGTYELVSTQDFGYLDPDGEEGTPIGINYERRPLYRETTVKGFEEDPEFAKKGDLMPPERIKSPWSRYDPETHPTLAVPVLTGPHQWGMAVDLNTCTSCNACVIACQAENNIPVVGKKEAANGRELHWIRIDRYYVGDGDDPDAVVMPVACQHCETAPCENVCPVQATAHSPEGLNDMAYNRCIGTRYCANNCPYKVRRFNFFNFNRGRVNDRVSMDDIPITEQMAKNPDVTVRFRGVIEKCSYCVQRINHAKIEAHVDGKDKVADGAVVTACEQVCPTQAITFGDLTDPNSRVSKLKYADANEDYTKREPSKRNYQLLSDLNTVPRTSYLGRVRNPNPKLA
ncbi:Fe-S-cluster-containing hydrogenase [Plesiocystis pacifica SIR-1]|uniref:Fe-S-cluster-containing hydrogenase n=1 Tax=Plesiocystis pacifica SIR-1 TaxID=391625 RepID=A6GFM0_9BACT|nr:4Fe-4S dicluster domain-containing protein [Plesiocystis pacifica]EDM75334.1 Fe-S-cluster-containing hydrogenase [Plesiocystis pacifica SIR-1]